jgi:hypothetical protein
VLDPSVGRVDHEVVDAPEPLVSGVYDREGEHFGDVDHERRVRRSVYLVRTVDVAGKVDFP